MCGRRRAAQVTSVQRIYDTHEAEAAVPARLALN